ncbi:hypothetical protein BD779DRAFT_1533165 [Infundibulicybe gibba]|nr:hypothetical protein BD779DRAFT_1533165 [Infundibulicybe gibba]
MASSLSYPPTLSTLKNHAHGWLRDLRDRVSFYAQPTIQPLVKSICCNEQREQTVVLRTIQILFEFHPQDQLWSEQVWSVNCGRAILGLVEIDSRLLRDTDPLLRFDADFFLEAMMVSLRAGKHLRISSRIISLPADPVNHPRAFRNLEIFEMRADGELIRDMGRRGTPERICPVCRCWLPLTGPGRCLDHLNT